MPSDRILPNFYFGPFAYVSRILLLVVIAAKSTSGFASPYRAQFDEFAVSTAHVLVWQSLQAMEANGIPLLIRSFRASRSASDVAALMSAHSEYFQRLLVTPGLIRLSGVTENAHWLAELEPHPDGTQGRVSVLSLRPPGVAGSRFPDWSFIPKGGRRLSHHAEQKTRHSALNSAIYAFNIDPDALMDRIESTLRREGWSQEISGQPVSRHRLWRSQAMRLVLFAQATPTGSILYAHVE